MERDKFLDSYSRRSICQWRVFSQWPLNFIGISVKFQPSSRKALVYPLKGCSEYGVYYLEYNPLDGKLYAIGKLSDSDGQIALITIAIDPIEGTCNPTPLDSSQFIWDLSGFDFDFENHLMYGSGLDVAASYAIGALDYVKNTTTIVVELGADQISPFMLI